MFDIKKSICAYLYSQHIQTRFRLKQACSSKEQVWPFIPRKPEIVALLILSFVAELGNLSFL